MPLCWRPCSRRLDGIGIWAACGLTDLDHHDGAYIRADIGMGKDYGDVQFE